LPPIAYAFALIFFIAFAFFDTAPDIFFFHCLSITFIADISMPLIFSRYFVDYAIIFAFSFAFFATTLDIFAIDFFADKMLIISAAIAMPDTTLTSIIFASFDIMSPCWLSLIISFFFSL